MSETVVDGRRTSRTKLTADDRAGLADRYAAGETAGQLAAEFGVSDKYVRHVVGVELRARRRELAAEGDRDLDTAALRVRYAAGLELVRSVDVAERWALFESVVYPSPGLLAASRPRAREPVLARTAKPCAGCGCDAETFLEDCKTCTDRRYGRLKRERAIAAKTAVVADPDADVPFNDQQQQGGA